jgi:hypothetical protein
MGPADVFDAEDGAESAFDVSVVEEKVSDPASTGS